MFFIEGIASLSTKIEAQGSQKQLSFQYFNIEIYEEIRQIYSNQRTNK